ncbi:phosphatidate cytidylyltransferase [Tautonia sp. JC769]|uniref:phosphatidate cytidylyltransferase n=1 Tax=Tautonia sp. JC769 TaxID=3232135 RepID=UPI0034596794
MTQESRDRLFGYEHAFDDPVTLAVTIGLAVALLVTPLILLGLDRLGKIGPGMRPELWRRYFSWLILVPLILVPILMGAFWAVMGIGILGLLCGREYSRATGLFREHLINAVIVVGIFLIYFAVLDNWYRLFVALTPLSISLMAAVAITADRPQGYIQRVALGVLGFTLFGTGLGHLAFLTNDPGYRPVLILVFLAVEANDVFAFLSGKAIGGPKLAPNTSPNKTAGGSLGALVLTTLLVVGIGTPIFRGTAIGGWPQLAILGMLISVVGQLGDLMLSSIKRDLGLKDMGTTIPGHGGLLDRFDSLILVAPVVFHYLNYFVGVGTGEPQNIFTGG